MEDLNQQQNQNITKSDIAAPDSSIQKKIDTRKRILLIFCGGTIAMAPDPTTGTLKPAKDAKYLLSLVPNIPKIVNVDSLELFNIDSTELVADHWIKIAQCVYDNYDYYDGFVVTHGTDTMADSATAVSFALGSNLNKPVIFTGAQVYPDKIGTDAKFNIENAFRVAMSNVRGVMIVFGHYVLLGCRSQKRHEADFNAFDSPAVPPLAHVRSDINWSSNQAYKFPDTRSLHLQAEFSPQILCLKVNASLSPETIEALLQRNGCKGIVFESLGAGNIPSRYLSVIRLATSKDIPVLIASPFVGGSVAHASAYSLGFEALRAGVIPTNDMTFIAAYAKLMWCLPQLAKRMESGELQKGQMVNAMKEMFAMNFVGEVTLD